MYIQSFERPLIELSHNVVHKYAKLIDNQYKLDIADLNAADKLEFVTEFMKINANLDLYIQEFLNYACQDRMYAEETTLGAYYV